MLAIALVRKRFKITEVELPFFGLFSVKAERAGAEKEKAELETKPRKGRTIQDVKAEDGGRVKDVEQEALRDSLSSQRAKAKGEDSSVEGVKQKIH